MEKKSIQKGITKDHYKFSTHPIYKQRYDIINSTKQDTKKKFDEKINQRFNFVKSKLFGFTESKNNKILKHLKDDYKIYAQSIYLSRKGKLEVSSWNEAFDVIVKQIKLSSKILALAGDLVSLETLFSA